MEKEILTHTVDPVVNDGKVIKTFMERDDAEGYAENMNDYGARASAREYGYEEGSPE